MDVGMALDKTSTVEPQSAVEVRRGITVRRTRGGVLVPRVHYSAHDERDPSTHPQWKAEERKHYSSQAAWDREQEIVDSAGGGELVFADTLVSFWKKIVINDPMWRPGSTWRVEAGFDHGKTNPTALERCYIDHDGTIYFCGEYYMPGKEVFEHVPELKRMEDIRKVSVCYADPSIFDMTLQQSSAGRTQERAKSINELYVEQGIELFSPFAGDRSDVSFAARLMLHWANLGEREPTVKIVCRNYADRPDHGLHQWDCPNLLWELMRRRRIKLSAQQLLNRNLAEALVAKDEHANDAVKYVLLSHPEPTVKTLQQRAQEQLRPLVEAGDLTSAMLRYRQMEEQEERESGQPAALGRAGQRRWRR